MTRKSITFISNRFVVVLLLASLVLLSTTRYKQYRQSKKVEAQIASLQSESRLVEEKNQQLENSLQYLSSESASERLARQQMNLKRNGEIAVVFLPSGPTNKTEEQKSNASNFRLWWNYFFGHAR